MVNHDALFAEAAKRFGLNPALLKEIIRLRCLGYNNTEIFKLSGISRVSVNRYLAEIKQGPNRSPTDLKKLVLLCMIIYYYEELKDLMG